MLPEALIESLKGLPGFDQSSFEEAHVSAKIPVSVRFNPAKISQPEIDQSGLPIEAKVPWNSFGFYLYERPRFTLDPLLHAGCYYVQEPSSMFLEQVLTQTTDFSMPLKILDACAAPGGKSTLALSFLNENSFLVSNEVIKQRAAVLEENCTKWGSPASVVTNNDPSAFSGMQEYFDLMIVDAPCSGSGLFRKDPSAENEWSTANVSLCSQRQQRILSSLIPALKRNGVLVYATCSFSKEENEEICDWIATRFGLTTLHINIKEEWGITEVESDKNRCFGYRFYPGKIKGEGFFIACFRKEHGSERVSKQQKAISGENVTKKDLQVISNFLDGSKPVSLFRHNERIQAVPEVLRKELSFLQAHVYLKKVGTCVGKMSRFELIPDHELALSVIASDLLPAIELDLATALKYLKKEDLSLNGPLSGWALMKYRGKNMGWAKFLRNRINNYYPAEWRIIRG